MKIDDLWIGDFLKVKATGEIGTFHGVEKSIVKVKISEHVRSFRIDELEATSEEEIEQGSTDKADAPPGIDLDEILKFKPELDLHVKMLERNGHRINRNWILRDQIKICQQFLRKAHRLNITRIRIIHGKGKGVLKNEVAHLLDSTKFVTDFEPTFDSGGFVVFLNPEND